MSSYTISRIDEQLAGTIDELTMASFSQSPIARAVVTTSHHLATKPPLGGGAFVSALCLVYPLVVIATNRGTMNLDLWKSRRSAESEVREAR
jgi:hypothetical protein